MTFNYQMLTDRFSILGLKSIFTLLLICMSQLLWASDCLVVFSGDEMRSFGHRVMVTSVAASEYSAQEALKAEFEKSDQNVINLGVSGQDHWVKFNLINNTTEPVFLEITYPILDEVECYLFDAAEDMVYEMITGEQHGFASRENSFKNFAFELPIPKGEMYTVLMKFNSGEQIMIPLRLNDKDGITEHNLVLEVIFGLYAGIMMVMFLYNLFIYFSTLDRSYLYYVIYIVFVGLAQAVLQGFAFKYFWPETPWMALHATNIFGALSGVGVLLFVVYFLDIERQSKLHFRIFQTLIALDILAIVVTISGNLNLSYNLINLIAGIGSFYVFYVAIHYSLKGSRPARFFLAAWTFFLTSVVLYVLKDFGIVPYNTFTTNALMAGSSIEIVLLSLALADRINILKKEKADSQRRELEVLQEKEQLVREQNVLLENKVTERTRELRETNSQLNQTLDELKQAQVQLVNAEKMASLGQLTAGIAHEINNPINFVAASVNPLRQDIEDMINVIERYDVLTQEKLESVASEMKAFKQQSDFEFTLQEINELLNGMEEGARRTAEIVQGLKNFSRLDESDSKFVSVHECLDSTLIIMRNLLGNNIKVEKQYDAKMEDIECYPGKLNQVFSNLMVNAVQAINEQGEGVKGTLTLRTHYTANQVTIEIQDDGPGIPEEVTAKIFEPFFTTKDVGEGTGLGLSIVYSIVESHYGEISVQSKPGEGTTFKIELPTSLN